MLQIAPPPVVFRGAEWPREQMAGMAHAWRGALARTPGDPPRALALVMANHPRAVALFFALSCVPAPLVLLPLDMRPWRSAPPVPPGTRLVLLPEQRELEADARALGLAVTLLGDADGSAAAADDRGFMRTPGLVLFTSGSTSLPRPVYRETPAVVDVARALVAGVGLAPGDAVIATLPLSRAFGLNHALMAATVLSSRLALLEQFDHPAVLRLFASRGYRYWAGTATMADVLSRARLPGAHPAPAVCLIGGHVSADLARRFRERFGIPLRQGYGTTETGSIAVDGAPADAVRSGSAGRPVPGVELRIGDDPRSPQPPGAPGRVWLSAPRYMMAGYGFPPDLEPPETIDGWWGSPDLGSLDTAGTLTLLGRLDDSFRTGGGHVVSPAAVTLALEGYPGVVDTAVVPLAGAAGPVLGLLVESAGALDPGGLRAHLARALPAWSQPRVVETTGALPRLPSGRTDRRACIAMLEQSLRESPGR